MKTLTELGVIGRLLKADEERRERQARWKHRRRRLSWHLQWLFDGAVRWVLFPVMKFVALVIAASALLGAFLLIFAR